MGRMEMTTKSWKETQKKAYDFASIVTAIVDGLSPFVASLFILAPFIFLEDSIATESVYYSSFSLAIMFFFLLGIFLGKVSKENIFATGFKLVLAGIACMIIILLIE